MRAYISKAMFMKFAGLLLTLVFLALPGQADAASNVFPDTSVSSPDVLYMTVGQGEFNVNSSRVLISVPSTGSYSITVEDAHFCNDPAFYTNSPFDLPQWSSWWRSPPFSTNFKVHSIADANAIRGFNQTTSNTASSCSSRDITGTIAVQASDYNSLLDRYVVVFLAQISANNPSFPAVGSSPHARENTFRVRVDGAQLFSMLGNTTLSNRNRTSDTTYAFNYAVNCNLASVVASVRILDDDYAVPPNSINPLPYTQFRTGSRPRSGGAWTYGSWTTLTGGDGGEHWIWHNETFSRDYIYRIELRNISWRDAVAMEQSGSSNFAEYFNGVTCMPPNAATCELVGGPTTVYFGERFTQRLRFTNNGSNTWSTSSGYTVYPSRDTSGSTVALGVPGSVATNQQFEIDVDWIPSSVGAGVSHTWHLRHNGTSFASCSKDIDVIYRPPVVTCSVVPPPISEAGTRGDARISVKYDNPSGGVANPSGFARAVSLSNGVAQSPSISPDPNPGSETVSISRGTWQHFDYGGVLLGDPGSLSWSGSVTVRTGNGIGGSHDVTSACTSSSVVGNYSYLREYGGDVWAGGNFVNVSPSCTPPTGSGGNAFGFAESTGSGSGGGIPYRGTGAQLTLTALLNINGVVSASTREIPGSVSVTDSSGTTSSIAGRTYTPKGLTFANFGNLPGNTSPDSVFGGGLGATRAKCITDYYNDTKDTTLMNTGDFPPPDVPGPVVPSQTGVVWADDINTPNRISVTAGRSYRVTVWGTWQNVFGSAGQYEVDAICQQNSGVWQVQNTDPANLRNHDLQLDVNGDGIMDFVDWVPTGPTIPGSPGCSGSHTYTYDTGIIGATGLWAMRVFDGFSATNTVEPDWYGDNNSGINFSVVCLNCSSPVPGSLPSGRSQYRVDNDLTLDGINVPVGSQAAVYVAGDVYISGNVIYATGASSVEQMPNFALIVCGNIYVGSGVTRLDGLYVAQPGNQSSDCDGSGTITGGSIYTCASGMGQPMRVHPTDNSLDLYHQCQNQLVVNGSLVANRIKFLRVYGSLRDGSHGEVPDDFADGSGTSAAEVVNYTPQMWIAPSALRVPGTPMGAEGASGSTSPYDSIRTLSPIF